ncbi:hypothetical protein DYE50_01260 [Treponema ruminis]|uniref:DUF6273 domain-containing protein n=1 Tax=Treponema ruminis TaxID=744515 RepID=A0A7W8LNA3_9SPIR|nr:DUF6273 domain-containing protein [Treponema ruminis]MBB5227401.1 hypothetical protein [Treponema ruminis]QSI01211.1 hypothetical protein DYE50_01260 [Treponema ruminis]
MKTNDDGILETSTLWTLDGFNKNKARVQIGDRIKLPDFTVPETEIKGQTVMSFNILEVSDEAVIVGKKTNGDFILIFEHCLFKSAVDLNNTKDFKKTQLNQYLSGEFLKAMQEAGIAAINCCLLSYDETFGEKRLNYFKKSRNRIAFDFKENFTKWYWLCTPYKSSAAYFCGVYSNGYADYYYAGNTDFYVRPRFVLAA